MLSTEPAAALSNILAAVGHTPLLRLERLCRAAHADLTLLAKAEFLNPGGSIHIRAALAIVREARKAGSLPVGGQVVEVSIGDEGIALAMLGAILDFRATLVMPADAPAGRRRVIEAFGATVHLAPAAAALGEGPQLCRDEARALAARLPQPCLVLPFDSPLHAAVHEEATGAELLAQLPLHHADAFVACVGTGGTLTGVARALRRRFPHVRVVAVRSEEAPALAEQEVASGGLPALDRTLIDQEVAVSRAESLRVASRLAREEGLLVGPVSGANVCAALAVGRELGRRATIATVLPDSGVLDPPGAPP